MQNTDFVLYFRKAVIPGFTVDYKALVKDYEYKHWFTGSIIGAIDKLKQYKWNQHK